MTLPDLLAHRGYAARYPENTQAALRAAVAAGARHLEFDIQLSRDRVPHLLHDPNFLRTGGVNAEVFALDASAIAQLPVAERARLGSAGPDVYAPPLADVVADLAGWPAVTAFVEIKKQSVEHFGVEVVLDAVLPVLEPVASQCVVISFEREVIERARRLGGGRVGWAFRSFDAKHRQYAETFVPEYLFCNVDRLPPAPEVLWEGPWVWVIYEIVDPQRALELHARGVAMIETMEFAELQAGLEKLR